MSPPEIAISPEGKVQLFSMDNFPGLLRGSVMTCVFSDERMENVGLDQLEIALHSNSSVVHPS